MSDIADRAAELQDQMNKSALASRRTPASHRGNAICRACDEPNDRPDYAICSDCLMDGRTAKPVRPDRKCETCMHVQPVPDTPDACCRCGLGITKVRTTRGSIMPLVPHIKHLCHAWEAPHPAAGQIGAVAQVVEK